MKRKRLKLAPPTYFSLVVYLALSPNIEVGFNRSWQVHADGSETRYLQVEVKKSEPGKLINGGEKNTLSYR
ncbi:hypothetical protein [Pseudomonas eucalypticola]|uniref:Uncharacterized protein n=1 Tax=Pseudomonas eucalypticola TaxID=2599595 RepID=A0A7D5D4Y2_9PSED|nr:hypothetical protein [Pseudomonas eucalypticola]QKZ02938.1 hypothetical protein HWQ56_03630 [Pseudomonas eucalypticola]